MADGQLTLAIPATAQNAPPMGDQVLQYWPEGQLPARAPIGQFRVQQRSLWGAPQINGPAHRINYIWTIPHQYTTRLNRYLNTLATWQDREYKAGRDGHLLLTDEINQLPAEEAPHSRTLLVAYPEDYDPNWVWGYGTHKVAFVWPENEPDITPIGVFADGSEASLLQFQMVEV
ncbi:MAG: hypothetical protein ACFB0C_15695 [Leptolyngbyaceae cyanobacterium]